MNDPQAINTKEPYRIDVHHHVLPSWYMETLEKVKSVTMFGIVLPDWNLADHLAVMDKNKIQIGMASIPAGFYFGSDAFARELARRCNEFLADLLLQHPTRFGAFAALPVPDVDGALAEAAYAFDTLKLDGVIMLSNVDGHYVGEAENDELFAELNRRETVVYIHPGDPPDIGIPGPILFPIDTGLETARAVMSLLYGGVFERYPDIKFIFSHCGGITPYLAKRIARGRAWVRGAGGPDPGMLGLEPEKKRAARDIELMQRQYYDSMTANAAVGLEALQAFAGPAHILLGTDHAILPPKFQPIKMRELKSYKGFNRSERMGVERGNALRLFPRLQEVLS
ncbi:amidohydrolase family protein [Chloroflexota bacterium]